MTAHFHRNLPPAGKYDSIDAAGDILEVSATTKAVGDDLIATSYRGLCPTPAAVDDLLLCAMRLIRIHYDIKKRMNDDIKIPVAPRLS